MRVGWYWKIMDSELQKYLEQMEARLGAAIERAKDESIASAREMQTEVLRYIGNTAEPFNVRMRHLEANIGN